ncbi:MAG: hypothetical protein ACI9ZT_001261 [Gammaproteobacteria bacterium]|jgi:hypothetical protein
MISETIILVIIGILLINLFPMIYIYNEIILPTLKEYGGDSQLKFLGSNQRKQIYKFLCISKEKNIHNNIRLYTQFWYYITPALILAFLIFAIYLVSASG